MHKDDTLNHKIIVNYPKRYLNYIYEKYMILYQKMVQSKSLGYFTTCFTTT
jgi:hypothetical protein